MTSSRSPWYSGVTSYQWLVLIVASLGWVFDAFEGQIYNLTRADMLPDLLQVKADDPQVKLWGERFLGIFLLGGTFGGLLFSSLADKWGRNPVMALTILFYSIFSGITAFATEIWQVGALRFLVAMGVGGEWAVGAALVAEVFPKEARERAGGISMPRASAVCGSLRPLDCGSAPNGERPTFLVCCLRCWFCGFGSALKSPRHGRKLAHPKPSAWVALESCSAIQDGDRGHSLVHCLPWSDLLRSGASSLQARILLRISSSVQEIRIGPVSPKSLSVSSRPQAQERACWPLVRSARCGVASVLLSSCISRH